MHNSKLTTTKPTKTLNFKVEYITRLFQRTSSKAIENYCLTRLWHRLDNDEIKIVPQQYVNRHTDHYALTDVYFPQVKIHVEVNEPPHYDSPQRIEADRLRKEEIEKHTGHKVRVIDCREDLSGIHRQIDVVVDEVRELVNKQKEEGLFKPWQPDTERNPLYWRDKAVLSVSDEISFSNIEDICSLFEANFKKTKRGFLRLGGIAHPSDKRLWLWWPSEIPRKGWVNELSSEELYITETHRDTDRRASHSSQYHNTGQVRVVFFHHRDILGLISYKFKGLYSYDSEISKPETGVVWKRISEKMNLQQIEI